VLINVGTNDARENFSISTIGERMDKMLSDIFKEVPGVTIILSTVLRSFMPAVEANRYRVNAQYRHIAHTRRYQLGQRIVLADLDSPGTQYQFYEAQHFPPNDKVLPTTRASSSLPRSFSALSRRPRQPA